MAADIPAVLAPPLDLATDVRVSRLSSGRPADLPVHGYDVSARIRAVLWLIAVAAILAPTAVVRFGPARHASDSLLVAIPGRAIPLAELPPVEPLAIRSLDPDAARAFNAGVPFSDAPNPAARPFRLTGAPDDLARATDCLAAAVYYEAGDDPPGERAVAQVVLNRLRHPAFPKTVCGVVFQGSDRPTGCQFTFACDGALARHTPTADGWRRAQALATAALAGKVDAAVGYATHYHTDYVVPYWQASLDKIVAVHTQLFYRWSGWWGTPPAFDRRQTPGEPVVAALAALSDAHRPAAEAVVVAAAADDGTAPEVGGADGDFLAIVPAAVPPPSYPVLAAKACGDRPRCRFRAWRSDRAHAPLVPPLAVEQIAAMAFSYQRDREAGIDRMLWNCRDAPHANPSQCLKQQLLLSPAAPEPAPTASPAPPAPLAGVERKDEPVRTPGTGALVRRAIGAPTGSAPDTVAAPPHPMPSSPRP